MGKNTFDNVVKDYFFDDKKFKENIMLHYPENIEETGHYVNFSSYTPIDIAQERYKTWQATGNANFNLNEVLDHFAGVGKVTETVLGSSNPQTDEEATESVGTSLIVGGAALGAGYVFDRVGLTGVSTMAKAAGGLALLNGSVSAYNKYVNDTKKNLNANQKREEQLRAIPPLKPLSSISLYQPGQLTNAFAHGWNESEGVYHNSFFNPKSEEAGSSLAAGVEVIGKQLIGQMVSKVSEGLSLRSREQSIGQVINPRLGLTFKRTNLRQFEMSFRFQPTSKLEVEEVIRIIFLFRYHSSSQIIKDTAGFLLQYPELWKIHFGNTKSGDSSGEVNSLLFKTTWSALTNVSVNYTPQALWATFENGFPVDVQMDLRFQEVDMITKDDLMEGY